MRRAPRAIENSEFSTRAWQYFISRTIKTTYPYSIVFITDLESWLLIIIIIIVLNVMVLFLNFFMIFHFLSRPLRRDRVVVNSNLLLYSRRSTYYYS